MKGCECEGGVVTGVRPDIADDVYSTLLTCKCLQKLPLLAQVDSETGARLRAQLTRKLHTYILGTCNITVVQQLFVLQFVSKNLLNYGI